MYTIVETTTLSVAQKIALLDIWNSEYPAGVALAGMEAFEQYLAGLSGHRHLLITDETGQVHGWLFLFEREQEQWFAVILSRTLQGQGWGRRLMQRAQQMAPVLHGWVIDQHTELKNDGSVYPSPLPFYEQLGFVVNNSRRLEIPIMSAVHIYWPRAAAIEKATPADYEALTAVWEASVRATHHFLAPGDIDYFKPLVQNEFLGAMKHLVFTRNEAGRIAGFAGVLDGKLEMLFIHPDQRGKGVGKELLRHAINKLGVTSVDVNEQNDQAVGFYLHNGFTVSSRSETDGMGKPYPLLHMVLSGEVSGQS
jgi:putative acetyltransferase